MWVIKKSQIYISKQIHSYLVSIANVFNNISLTIVCMSVSA